MQRWGYRESAWRWRRRTEPGLPSGRASGAEPLQHTEKGFPQPEDAEDGRFFKLQTRTDEGKQKENPHK